MRGRAPFSSCLARCAATNTLEYLLSTFVKGILFIPLVHEDQRVLTCASLQSICQLAKVITHRGQPDCLAKLLAVPSQCTMEVKPELATRRVAHSEDQHDAKQS